jgi:hypothetical protein
MPTIRTVVFAKRRYGIAIPYLGTSLFSGRQRNPMPQRFSQLVLPFSVRSVGAFGVESKISAIGENRFELRVNVKSAA